MEKAKATILQPLKTYEENCNKTTDPAINPNYISPKMFMLRLQKLMDEYAGGVSMRFTTTEPLLKRGLELLALLKEDAARLGAKDVHVVQSYENFTGGVLMSLVEHGFFAPEEANDFLTVENLIAPGGRLPLNTSGGNLAECYMHGLELQIEAVRQIRGQSTSQVADVDVSMVISGPMVTPVSSMILGTEATL